MDIVFGLFPGKKLIVKPAMAMDRNRLAFAKRINIYLNVLTNNRIYTDLNLIKTDGIF